MIWKLLLNRVDKKPYQKGRRFITEFSTVSYIKKQASPGCLFLNVFNSVYILNPTVSTALPPVFLTVAPEKGPFCKR
jgi:hypothetical protein